MERIGIIDNKFIFYKTILFESLNELHFDFLIALTIESLIEVQLKIFSTQSEADGGT